jgi:hypothetical protein
MAAAILLGPFSLNQPKNMHNVLAKGFFAAALTILSSAVPVEQAVADCEVLDSLSADSEWMNQVSSYLSARPAEVPGISMMVHPVQVSQPSSSELQLVAQKMTSECAQAGAQVISDNLQRRLSDLNPQVGWVILGDPVWKAVLDDYDKYGRIIEAGTVSQLKVQGVNFVLEVWPALSLQPRNGMYYAPRLSLRGRVVSISTGTALSLHPGAFIREDDGDSPSISDASASGQATQVNYAVTVNASVSFSITNWSGDFLCFPSNSIWWAHVGVNPTSQSDGIDRRSGEARGSAKWVSVFDSPICLRPSTTYSWRNRDVSSDIPFNSQTFVEGGCLALGSNELSKSYIGRPLIHTNANTWVGGFGASTQDRKSILCGKFDR